ncbi:glycosyltransferase family 4 protein [Clostridium perfringens]|uniref:glycosyltransferase family 4 protein n=1 Tax=Clostridium perfringens TaxID=1502 RepID=UPI0032DB1106
MKILFVSHDGKIKGGAGLALIELIDSMIKLYNIEPIVLVPKNGEEIIEYLENKGIEYIINDNYWWCIGKNKNIIKQSYHYIKLILKQFKMLLGLRNLNKKIKEKNIDLIHTNSSVVNIGALLNYFYGIPHIWHVREFGEEHHNLVFIFGEKKTREFMARTSDYIVVISEALKRKYIKYVNKEKVIRIYDGLPKKYFNYNEKKTDMSVFNIISVGAIQKGKRQKDLILAILKILEKGYKINLYIVGRKDDEAYYNEILDIIKSHDNIKNNIIFKGYCDNMNKIRSDMDLEVVCSMMEGFGRVTVEAMLSALPVIVSRSGANTELVKENENGLIYDINNIDELSEKILEIYMNRENGVLMGKRGYEIAEKNFTQEQNSKNIYNLYSKVLKR